jgi:hypothetical protein
MGQFGEGYPNGSAYTCTFSGKFENFEKVDAYSYKMTLADIQTEKTVGEEWIENGIRYIATGPHGLNDPDTNQVCEEFVFYLPDTPVEQVQEGFLSWWPYRYLQESGPKTLSCYGILNVTTEFGFFTAPTAEFADPFAEIMESPDEQPQLSKDEFIEITNHYLSTNKWDLPSEKACFYTYGVNHIAYIIDNAYLFSLHVQTNLDGSVEYNCHLSHYIDGVLTETEYDPSLFEKFIK